jgi:predicted amidophosphoribosyltransferase
MAPLVPPGTILVPLVRVGWRRLRYGIDPAADLCERLALLTRQPVAYLLAAPWFGPAQAPRSRLQRRPPIFKLRAQPGGRVVLVDDVVTTGGTIERARDRIGPTVVAAVAATAVSD